MITKIIIAIKNLKIKYKILLCMIAITTTALFFISFISYSYFASVYEKDTKSNTRYTLNVASASFRNHINSTLKNAGLFVTSPPMLTTLKDISLSNKEAYIYNYGYIQDDLERLIQSENFIDNILVIGKNKDFFALTKYGLNHDVSTNFGWDLGHVSGISLLTIRKNPLDNLKNVIPIILPISSLNIASASITPIISGTPSDSIANLFILLDAKRVTDYFKEFNKNKDSVLYLANEDGEPLDLLDNSDIYNIATNPDVVEHIKSTKSSEEFNKSIDNDSFLIASEAVDVCGLKIVSVVSKRELLSGIDAIKSFILGEWVLSFGLTVILALMLSQFITRPIVSLMDVVNKIINGTYNIRTTTKYNDEIGILYRSINSMYDTIQFQIEQIKQEEQDKSKSEIKILTEQINPHFIYNTLECIHLEILSNNTVSSAAMIESLGEFLRISLNYGHDIIPIKRELKHITEYINIMNHRSNQKIAFRYTIDERLNNYQVVKLILQPLVENCIKHGFASDIKNNIILSPYIEVNINLKQDNRIHIEVSDNGRGINVDEANDSLYQLSDDIKSNHVGLNNVYKRLRLYYGNSTNIKFYTTPYYKSSVVINIPYININNKKHPNY